MCWLSWTTFRRVAMTLGIVLVTVSAIHPAIARAQETSSLVVQFNADCSHLTAGALQYIKAHRIDVCRTRPYSPIGQVSGDCGTLTMSIYPNGSPGGARLSVQINGTLGTFIFWRYNLPWDGTVNGGNWTGGGPIFTSNPGATTNVTPGRGYAFFSDAVGIVATTWWGLPCTGGPLYVDNTLP